MRIRLVEPSERPLALGRLVMGAGVLSDAQQRKLDQYAEQMGFDYRHLWGAFDEETGIAAATLLVPRPGRTAMLFHSPVKRHDQAERVVPVIDAACEAMPSDEATMAQALLNTSEELEQWMLEKASFDRLAVLEYMQTHVPRTTLDVPMPDGVTLIAYDPAHRPLFTQALDASYEQTLDCPGLRGLRATEDVLIGHQATGVFDPSLWHVAVSGGRVVGVMLLNQVPGQTLVELVYLGIAPSARGRGLARALMQHGLWLCAQREMNMMSLAVDESNTPAMKLYRRLGFARTACKLAMVRRLK